jgi:hypothetical protein
MSPAANLVHQRNLPYILHLCALLHGNQSQRLSTSNTHHHGELLLTSHQPSLRPNSFREANQEQLYSMECAGTRHHERSWPRRHSHQRHTATSKNY